MSLRYGLLGLLTEKPASGYDLSQQFQDILGAVWPASHPQIYTALNKMLDEGQITIEATGARGKKVYAITGSGRLALTRWLSESSVDHTLRSESLMRSFFFDLMEPADLQKHLDNEIAFFEARIALYKRYAAAKERGEHGFSPRTSAMRIAVESGIRLYSALREWGIWTKRYTKHDDWRRRHSS